MFKGTAASPGIVLGKALVLEHNELVIEKKSISDVETEIARLNEAVAISKTELEKVRDKAKVELGEEEAQIFESHLLVLEDPELLGSTMDKVKTENVNADFALNEIKEMFVGMFEAMDNEYMRERAADIKDVTNRILRHLLGVKIVDLAALEDEVVLVAAHGNSLRALAKHIEKISDDDIMGLEIPTGQPLVYELDNDLNMIKKYYL